MEATLKNKIREAVQVNVNFMEAEGAALVDPVWTIFGEAVVSIKDCFGPVMDSESDDDHVLFLMCCNALSDSFAAFMSIRQGFLRPPAIIMRGVVENMAAVVTFLKDPKAMSQFKQDRYDIPKAVGPSKEHFPELAIQYGILTNKFTHETYASVGRSLGKEKGVFFVPKIDGQSLGLSQAILLSAIAMIVHNIGQIVEFCFIRHLKTPQFWEQIDSEHLRSKTTEGRKLVGVLAKKLEDLLASNKPSQK